MEAKTTKVKCWKETIYGLTFGKIYDVIEEDFMFFKIINDNNDPVRITKDEFWNANNE